MPKFKRILTQNYLKEILHYDSKSGIKGIYLLFLFEKIQN